MHQTKLRWITLLFGFFTTLEASAVQMSFEAFVALAGRESQRCISTIKTQECEAELKYALDEKIIDKRTYDWGKSQGYYPTFKARGTQMSGICKCGCFAEGTSILTAGGWKNVEDFSKGDDVAAYDGQSSLKSPRIVEQTLSHAVSGYEENALYVFELENEARLSVTQHHGMVLANGAMKAARDVQEGDAFVDLEGRSVRIVRIEREKTDRPVYNLEVETPVKSMHIISAEGVLVGDLVWQNQFKKDMEAIELRR